MGAPCRETTVASTVSSAHKSLTHNDYKSIPPVYHLSHIVLNLFCIMQVSLGLKLKNLSKSCLHPFMNEISGWIWWLLIFTTDPVNLFMERAVILIFCTGCNNWVRIRPWKMELCYPKWWPGGFRKGCFDCNVLSGEDNVKYLANIKQTDALCRHLNKQYKDMLYQGCKVNSWCPLDVAVSCSCCAKA